MNLTKHTCFVLLLVAALPLLAEKDNEAELLKNTFCQLSLEVKVPYLKPQALQWAFFDKDPAVGFQKKIGEMRTYCTRIVTETQDEKTKLRRLSAVMTGVWNGGFSEITGDKVYLCFQGKENPCFSANMPMKAWLVTKTVQIAGEPACWAIPIEAKPGNEYKIILTKDNAFRLKESFDQALASQVELDTVLAVETGSRYPRDTLFRDDPRAHAGYDRMLTALKKAQTLSFESQISSGVETYKPEARAYRMWLKKPNYARIEATRKGMTSGILIGDGQNFWIYWPNRRPMTGAEDRAEYVKTCSTSYSKYQSPQGRHSLWHHFGELGVFLPVFEPSVFHGCREGLEDYLDGVRSHGSQKLGADEYDVIEVSYMKNQRSRYYWLSRADHLPRKTREVIRVEQDYVREEVWSNVVVDAEVSDTLFEWNPPEGWVEFTRPDPETGLLKKGTLVPDFTMKATDGRIVKLSELRGRIVLLYFWRAG